MKLFTDLCGSGAMKSLWDLRRRSLLDFPGNASPNLLSFTNSPVWTTTQKGAGVRCYNTAGPTSHFLTPGNPASLQLSTMTIFAVAARQLGTGGGVYQGILAKPSAVGMYFDSGAEPRIFGAYDFSAGAYRASTFTERPRGVLHLFAMSCVSGIAGGTAFYVDGNAYGTATLTIANQATGWGVGYGASAGQALDGPVLLAGIVNRVLTPQEHENLFEEWQQQAFVLDIQHRRGARIFVPDKSDADYAREGIVFDTRFKRQPGGTIRDEGPTGYAGTNTSCPVSGADAEGLSYDGVDDYTDFGNVTQINSVAACSIELLFRSKANANNSLVQKASNSQNRIGLELLDAANPSRIRAVLCNGAGTFGDTASFIARQGQWHHATLTYNGLGATDADKLKLYLDRDLQTLNFTGPIPATTGTMAGNLLAACRNIGAGAALFANAEEKILRVFNRTLSAGDTSNEYLRNFGQECIWQAPGEDIPVSLAASYGVGTPNALGGGWVINSGTWNVNEETSGRRYQSNVTAGSTHILSPATAGTWTFAFLASGTVCEWMFMAAVPGRFNVSGAQNGYFLRCDGNYALSLRVATAGVDAILWSTANGYVVANTWYRVAISRRPSDGTFTAWIKGGAYTSWTLITVTAGTNPVANATHWTSSYQCLFANGPTGRFLIHDPTLPGSPCPTRIFRGVLNPLAGEIG